MNSRGFGSSEFKIKVEFDENKTQVFDGSRPTDELWRQIIAAMNQGAAARARRGEAAAAKKQTEEANQTADELLKAIDDESAKRADQLHRALTTLLVPPIALLIFGVAIAWVASGFRRRRAI